MKSNVNFIYFIYIPLCKAGKQGGGVYGGILQFRVKPLFLQHCIKNE